MYPNTDSERLKIVLEKLDIDPYRLTLFLDYKYPSKIYNILKGKETMDDEFILFFIHKYPQLNFLFLKEGKGKPVLTISEAISQRNILGLANNSNDKDTEKHTKIADKRRNLIRDMMENQTLNKKPD
ncbi:hypothetical protein [Abyssalbus ytuae]|uniref:Uncharacterized protein n=1 Tax=Abyssalbus ytuae TaxID=2926907 RepID=A0A9E6ZR36_9FLAO|nr:hypothetical protein [Abyssalbus ytuae]UOB17253.1 hypothetical protein MQE35_16140 [Abyssalbus ytuae]